MTHASALPAAALGLLGLIAAGPAPAAEYTIDPAHTQANFQVDHLGFSTIWGRFDDEAGVIVFDPDNVEASSVEIVIQTASVDTNYDARDEDLRSPDFFNSAEFPEMTFKSTKVEKTGDNTGKVTGDLTFLGVTKPVTLDVEFNKVGSYPWDDSTEVVGFSATTVIDRTAFGMTFMSGAIGDQIQVDIEVEANRPL
jgi:polyisoprenoid-binding protein YceI